MSKRVFDALAALVGLAICAPLMIGIGLAVRLTSPGPALHWSKRIGRRNVVFAMPKFRTMRLDTPQVATHLMNDPARWATPVGPFLRRSSLDELPQLWSVLKGDMSLVGPRPALYNQDDLVSLRTAAGLTNLRPGITGWAQVNGRDDLPIPLKVDLDREYGKHASFVFDLMILWRTLTAILASKGVSH